MPRLASSEKSYEMKNIFRRKKNKYDDPLEKVNISFNKNIMQEVLKVVIINDTLKETSSVMEGPIDEHHQAKYYSESFAYVLSEILFRKMSS